MLVRMKVPPEAGAPRTRPAPGAGRSLRFTILGAFSLLILATGVAIVGYGYRANKQAMLRLSNDLIEQATDALIEKTRQYVRPASIVVRMTAAAMDGTSPRGARPGWYERYSLAALQAYPQLAMLNLGDRDGNFLMYKRMPDGTIASKVLRRGGGQPEVTWTYRDPQGAVTRVERPTTRDDYDPRVRGWYEGAVAASGLFWSDVYIFYTDRKPGVAASCPFADEAGVVAGVVGLDIELAGLSRFLSTLRIGRSGFAYILNDRGQVIAFPGGTRTVGDGAGGPRLLHIDELERPALRKAYAHHRRTGEPRLVIEHEGVRYIAAYVPFPESVNQSWRIGVLVPEDDFVVSLASVNRATLTIALVVLVLSIGLAFLVSRAISRPMEQLTREALRIRDLQLDGEPRVHSPIREIDAMAAAITAMKVGLRAFARYVPAGLVQRLVRTGEEARIGGRRARLTIMFTDIASFTSFSETVSPEELTQHLSAYLDAMTGPMMATRGTVDKYMGDGIMAFWGAPEQDPEHARHACEAARSCLSAVARLNDRWRREGKWPLQTRIGLHTAETVVGNVGSRDRMNYTVLGDGVNVASRLEGACRHYGVRVLLSEATRQLAGDGFLSRPLDLVVVKGRRQALKVHELMATTAEAAEQPELAALARRFAEGFNAYQQRRFAEALQLFQALASQHPDDKPCQIYVERCQQLVAEPPGPDWSPETQLLSK